MVGYKGWFEEQAKTKNWFMISTTFNKWSLAILMLFAGVTAQSAVRYVTSTNDTYSPGEVRYELENAAAGDTVIIDVSTYGGPPVMLNNPIDINNPLIVIGPNPIHFVIDASGSGGPAFRIGVGGAMPFEMTGIKVINGVSQAIEITGGFVNIRRCVFTNNNGGSGGAVYNNGGVTLFEACSFMQNNGGTGGAVYNSNGASLTLQNCTFYDNQAGSHGGAIYNIGATTALNCIQNTFYSNDAVSLGGAIQAFSGNVFLHGNIIYNNQSAGADENLSNSGATWASGDGNYVNSNAANVAFANFTAWDAVGLGLDPMMELVPWVDGFGLEYFRLQPISPCIDWVTNMVGLTQYDVRLSYRTMEAFGMYFSDAGAVEFSKFTIRNNSGGAAADGLWDCLDRLNTTGYVIGPYSVVFEITGGGPYTINQINPYDVWPDQTTINGYTQENSLIAGPGNGTTTYRTPANTVIEINGGGAVIDGMNINGVDIIVAGLSITNRQAAGIYVDGDVALITGNHIGVTPNGLTSSPNDIGIYNNIDDVIIGNNIPMPYLPGVYYARSNVVSGNNTDQIFLDNTWGSIVRGNLIGLDATGVSTPIGAPVGATGIYMYDGSDAIIGGDRRSKGNIISGNDTGIYFDPDLGTGDMNTTVFGNKVGTDITGSLPLPNQDGIYLDGWSSPVTNVFIGSPNTGEGNLISGNAMSGIVLDAVGDGTGSNYVQGNIIGLDATGTSSLGNGLGIMVASGSLNNIIGGSGPGQANIISGNTGAGIDISGLGTSGNYYNSNIIGLDVTGTTALGNDVGIQISGDASEVIGGNSIYPFAGNVISGNTTVGINVFADAGTVLIQGNVIGLQGDGIGTVGGTTQDGIWLEGVLTQVGDPAGIGAGGGGNIISGNSNFGVSVTGDNNILEHNWIGVDINGDPKGNNIGIWVNGADGTQIMGGGFYQIISANSTFGIEITGGATNTNVAGNFIGTDGTGDASTGHGNGVGIRLAAGANLNYIGGIGAPVNVISGNVGDGIQIFDPTTDNNFIAGNYIGIDYSSGGVAVPNGSSGISTNNCSTNFIGYTATIQDYNVISGNTGAGIYIGNTSSDVRVYGNLIGTDIGGAFSIPNADGIVVNGSIDNYIGFDLGSLPNSSNTISGNSGAGIEIQNSTGTYVFSNYIGTDMGGVFSLGTQQEGVTLNGTSNNNQIGASGNRSNLISGNSNYGVFIDGATAAGNYVENNMIGTDASGSSTLANTYGIRIDNGANGNYIGGTAGTSGNLISGNTTSGIYLTNGASGNDIDGNIIGPDISGIAPVLPATNFNGIEMDGGANLNIIGNGIGLYNIIGYNSNGVYLHGAGTSNNDITGNYIGVDPSGTNSIPNLYGVYIADAANNNNVGGTAAFLANAISGNSNDGIVLDGMSLAVDGTYIAHNYIGTTPNGLSPMGNGSNGIYGYNCPNTIIGGPAVNEWNVIAANGGNGIEMENSGTTGLYVQSNMIGLDVNGQDPSTVMGNGNNGVALRTGVDGALVGGDSGAGEGNVIGSHMGSAGIMITDSDNNDIKGNNIGIGPGGTAAEQVPNYVGIVIESPTALASTGNTIGGTVGSGEDNIIAGNVVVQVAVVDAGSVNNTITGNLIGVDIAQNPVNSVPGAGVGVAFNGTGANLLGGTDINNDNNVIGVLDTAVICIGSNGVDIFGNYIGVQDDGFTTISNGVGVALIAGAVNNTVGSTGGTAYNVISGNYNEGVYIADPGTDGNVVQENIIGLDEAGTGGIPNLVGVAIANGATNNSAGPANLISGNSTNGVLITDAGTSLNSVEANLIGTDFTGINISAATQNGVGVSLENGASGNFIGSPGLGNVIGGNNEGIGIYTGANGNMVQSNYIGIGLDGISSVGNSINGILDNSGTANNYFGGDYSLNEENYIGNNQRGIRLNNAGNGSQIYGNGIGVTPGGSAAGNLSDGIWANGTFSGVIIGAPGNFANEIAFNGASGIRIGGASVSGIDVSGNSIHDNVAIGIDIFDGGTGPSANDAGDVDSGNNTLQNFPVISSAFDCGTGGVTTNVTFNCDFMVGNSYRIEFYQADAANQEGQTYLGGGLVNVTIANEEFTIGIPYVAPGTQLVATATETGAGNTSEFSFPAFAATASPMAPTLSATLESVCPGVTPSTVTATGSYTIVQYTDDPPTIPNYVGTGSTFIPPNPGTPGVYQYYVYDSIATCYSPSTIFTLTVLPTPPAIDTAVSYCESTVGSGVATVDLTTLDSGVDGGAGNTVTWWSDAGCTISIGTPGAYNASNGFNVYALVDDGSCNDTAMVTFTINAMPDGSTASTDVLCFGGSDGTIDLTMSAGTPTFIYSWTGPGGPYSSEDLSGLAVGSYTVTITDANSCVNTLATITISEPPAITVPTPSFSNVTCNGLTDGTVGTTGASGGMPGYSYTWQQVGGGIVGGGTSASGLGAGDYYVEVLDGNGCTINSDTVTVSEPPAISLATGSMDMSCFGVCDGWVSVAPSGGTSPYTYNWVGSVVGPVGTSTTDTVFSLCADSYSISVTDALGCTVGFSPVIITEPAPITHSSAVTDENCGAADGSIEVTASGGTSPYQFDIDGTGFTSFSNPHTYTGLTAGSYTIQVQDANGCLSTMSNESIAGTSGINFLANFIDPTCNGDSGSVVINSISGGTPPYQFSSDGGGTWQADSNFTLPAGSYDFWVTDGTCTSFLPLTLVEPPPLTFSSIVVQPGCDSLGGSITLSASGGNGGPYFYGITNPDTLMTALSGVFDSLWPSNWIVIVSDAGGCVGGGSIQLDVTADCSDLGAPNAFSPDGDGINDEWIVDRLAQYPENKVIIFNRWGDILIEFENYNNMDVVWNGTNSSGELLPSGTYFYVIELIQEERLINGWVQLTR